MKRYLMMIESALVFIIGLSYYFEFTMIKSSSLKIYGFVCLILAVILACSQLPYMPLKLSNRLAPATLFILIALQVIPFTTWIYHANEAILSGDTKIEFVELTSPILIILVSLSGLLYFLCALIKRNKKRRKIKNRV